MRNPRETWDMTSSYLGRKKEIPQKTIDQRTRQPGNGMDKMMKSIQQIPEIMLVYRLYFSEEFRIFWYFPVVPI